MAPILAALVTAAVALPLRLADSHAPPPPAAAQVAIAGDPVLLAQVTRIDLLDAVVSRSPPGAWALPGTDSCPSHALWLLTISYQRGKSQLTGNPW